ncbi:MAG: hypothetical protein JWM16_1945 [Verrucomicrobiales bacterium]|nr:hypothetical protein [Verrucomicrobiales bacterium]
MIKNSLSPQILLHYGDAMTGTKAHWVCLIALCISFAYTKLGRAAEPPSTAAQRPFAQSQPAPGQPELKTRQAKAKTAFNALPRGTQVFDGVTFDIPRPFNLIGSRAARAGGQEFARIHQDSIRGRGRYIHVLHTGDHGASPKGDYLWRLVLHYSDGEMRHFDFAYGVHIYNFWRRTNERDLLPLDPDSAIVWIGTSEESDRSGAELIISRTTLSNPRPDIEVTSADYISLLGPSSAYVFGVTLSDNGPKPSLRDQPSAPNIATLPFIFQNSQGQPEPDAILNCTFKFDNRSVRLSPVKADALGQVTIDVPIRVISEIHYQAQEPSGKIDSGILQVEPANQNWKSYRVRF